MRSSGKSRNKNRNNGRRPNPGNVINRVFDVRVLKGKLGVPHNKSLINIGHLLMTHNSQVIGFLLKIFNSTLSITLGFY